MESAMSEHYAVPARLTHPYRCPAVKPYASKSRHTCQRSSTSPPRSDDASSFSQPNVVVAIVVAKTLRCTVRSRSEGMCGSNRSGIPASLTTCLPWQPEGAELAHPDVHLELVIRNKISACILIC